MNIGKENESVEFKKSTSELKQGIISLSSMLNKAGQGILYFGVANNGDIVGQEIGEDTLRKISEAISNSVEPAVIPSINELSDPSGKPYIKVEVSGTDTPYSAYGLYYVRSADQDRKATRESLRKMFTGSGFDFIRETESTRQDLTFAQLTSLLTAKNYHVRDQVSFARNEGLVNTAGRYNQMAELLSDQSDVSIKAVRFSGKDKTAMSQRKELGNRCLIVAMQLVMDYVEVLDEVNVDLAQGQRRETHLFDFSVFREAWINACLHNSWNELTPPAVYIFSDRIEVISYGGLPYGLSLEEFYQGKSHPVNKALQMVFSQLDYTEQTGHGVPMIVSVYGKEAFHISDHFITVVIPFAYEPAWARSGTFEHQQLLSNSQKELLDFLKENPHATSQDAAETLGCSESTVKKYTARLKQLGLLVRSGSRKTGFWSF
jgi:predicted HTH transcriptional regulator